MYYPTLSTMYLKQTSMFLHQSVCQCVFSPFLLPVNCFFLKYSVDLGKADNHREWYPERKPDETSAINYGHKYVADVVCHLTSSWWNTIQFLFTKWWAFVFTSSTFNTLNQVMQDIGLNHLIKFHLFKMSDVIPTQLIKLKRDPFWIQYPQLIQTFVVYLSIVFFLLSDVSVKHPFVMILSSNSSFSQQVISEL